MPVQQKQIQVQKERQKAQRISVVANTLLEKSPEDLYAAVMSEQDRNQALVEKVSESDRQTETQEVKSKKGVGYAHYGVSDALMRAYEYNATQYESLIDHMAEQIESSDLNKRQCDIAHYIVGCIDGRGYLTRGVEAIADDLSFGGTMVDGDMFVDPDEVAMVLHKVQRMDPIGIGTSDLKECLLVQLEARSHELTPLAVEVIDKHFSALINNKLDTIAAAMHITIDKLDEVIRKEIRKLNPRPGLVFGSIEETIGQHITPTFIVSVDDNDEISYEIPSNIPEFNVSESYKAVADACDDDGNGGLTKKVLEDIKTQVDNANVFISALKQRQQTLKQVIEAIISLQHDFFVNNGDETMLKPMTLEDLRTKTGRDTSVLSRATAGKYMDTPWGIMPLRELFSGRMSKTNDEGVEETISTRKIQNRLKELVDAEDKFKPLSDQKLCDMLKGEGYDIARRTVAKYREKMGVRTAGERKKFK